MDPEADESPQLQEAVADTGSSPAGGRKRPAGRAVSSSSQTKNTKRAKKERDDQEEDKTSEDGTPAGKRGKKKATSRYDSSLGLLTKKFVQLLQDTAGGVLDLNSAALMLGVQKRRIYDITNVLEGIGLIEKKSKNNIQWRGSGMGSVNDMRKEMATLRTSLDDLNKQELLIDDYIDRMQWMLKDLADHRDNAQLAYVTHDDVRNLPSFAGQTLIAIKAPSGTTLEVPDPDEGMQYPNRRYQIFLKSGSGPIDVYLVSQGDDDGTGPGSGAAPDMSMPDPPESPAVPQRHIAPVDDEEKLQATIPTSPMKGRSKQEAVALAPAGVATEAGAAPAAALPADDGTTLVKLQPPEQQSQYYYNLDSNNEGISDYW